MKYIGDIPFQQGELHAAFVLSTRANCDVVNVDANDIPGINRWKNATALGMEPVQEEIFCSGKSMYAGQSLGLVVATTREIALEAAKQVKVDYGSGGSIVVDMEKAMEIPSNVIPSVP